MFLQGQQELVGTGTRKHHGYWAWSTCHSLYLETSTKGTWFCKLNMHPCDVMLQWGFTGVNLAHLSTLQPVSLTACFAYVLYYPRFFTSRLLQHSDSSFSKWQLISDSVWSRILVRKTLLVLLYRWTVVTRHSSGMCALYCLSSYINTELQVSFSTACC